MSLSAKALLDELMGHNRNAPLNSEIQMLSWKDETICQYYLCCGWCPVRHFEDSKCDIGRCHGKHNEVAKIQFHAEEKWTKVRKTYQRFLDLLYQLQDKLEKRKKFNQFKLDEVAVQNEQTNTTPGYQSPQPVENSEFRQQLEEMEERIEQLGEEGKVEEAQRLMNQMDILKNAKEHLAPAKISRDGLSKLFSNSTVCEVCGGVTNQEKEKLRMHNEGRIHKGYLRIPGYIKEIEDLMAKHKDEAEGARSASKEKEREKSGSKDRRRRERGRRRRRRRERSRSTGRRRRRERSRSSDRWR